MNTLISGMLIGAFVGAPDIKQQISLEMLGVF